MMALPNKDLTLAFAGMIQSATLVRQLAKEDRHDEEALWQSAQSLIRLDADRAEEVYGSVHGVELGLRKIVLLFGAQSMVEDRDIFNYTIFVHQISTKLVKLEKTSRIIHAELEEIRQDLHRPGEPEYEPERLFESLAGLYTRTISYLTPRIIVRGESGRFAGPGHREPGAHGIVLRNPVGLPVESIGWKEMENRIPAQGVCEPGPAADGSRVRISERTVKPAPAGRLQRTIGRTGPDGRGCRDSPAEFMG